MDNNNVFGILNSEASTNCIPPRGIPVITEPEVVADKLSDAAIAERKSFFRVTISAHQRP